MVPQDRTESNRTGPNRSGELYTALKTTNQVTFATCRSLPFVRFTSVILSSDIPLCFNICYVSYTAVYVCIFAMFLRWYSVDFTLLVYVGLIIPLKKKNIYRKCWLYRHSCYACSFRTCLVCLSFFLRVSCLFYIRFTLVRYAPKNCQKGGKTTFGHHSSHPPRGRAARQN